MYPYPVTKKQFAINVLAYGILWGISILGMFQAGWL